MEITQTMGSSTKAINLLFILSMVMEGSAGPAVDFKRHYSGQPNSGSATRVCRSVCLQVNQVCSNTCYKPQGTAHTTFSTPWRRDGTLYNVQKDDSAKFQCMDRCLKNSDDPYLIPDSCERPDDEDEEPTTGARPTRGKPQTDEAGRIDLSSLTTKRRCELQAYRNSTVCRFEDAAPDIAKKVFDANKPKLTLCMGGSVMSGRRGLYTTSTLKSFVNQQNQLRLSSEFESSFSSSRLSRSVESQDDIQTPSTSGRKKRSKRDGDDNAFSFENLERPKNIVKRRVKRQSSRRDRRVSKELCITDMNVESPSRAIHRATGQLVDIYFYDGYSQWFQMGSCKHSDPVMSVNVRDAQSLRCGMAMTAHKAYIVIDPAKMKDAHKVKDCGTIPARDSKYQICNDWVYLPSHCKLFYS
ncbi:uncharacterized protein LOC120335761 isoform X1 [Styela clava]